MPTSCFLTCFDGKDIEQITELLKWGGGNLGWFHQFRCRGFGGHGYYTPGCFLLCLPSSRFNSSVVTIDSALSVMLGRLIFKGGLPLFPLNRVAEISLVVATVSAKKRLISRHRAPSGHVGSLHATLESAYAQV